MSNNDKIIRVLNDILGANNSRTEGYQLATQNAEEADLKGLFSDFTASGYKFCHDLVEEVEKLKGKPMLKNDSAGKTYKAWMDVKSAINAKDRSSILSSVENGEDAALNLYEEALKEEALFNTPIALKLQQQRLEILRSQDKIQKMRNIQK